jgi:PPK2 family polyphosphate:nucleotide phosphotransferase
MLLSPVEPGADVSLRGRDARPPEGVPAKKAIARETDALRDRLTELSSRLYAEGTRALLVVLQARDGGGKDGTIRNVFGAVNPQGLQVTPFRAPTALEARHDFLWRVHANVPPHGIVGVFSRSHYEAVLVERVRGLAPEEAWAGRYDEINDWERMLARSGTTILKFFLHVSRSEQKRRMLRRLDQPRKRWKFDPGDLEDRARWDDYTAAYRDALSRCSTPWAPWYVVPADDKAVRDHLVAGVVVDALERMDPRWPEADPRVLALRDGIR